MILEYSDLDIPYDLNDVTKTKLNFDEVLAKRWNEVHDIPGVFRYRLKIDSEVVLPGKFNFILQLNADRATNRRPPENIDSIRQELDPQKFNFNKVSEKEILFQIKCKDSHELFPHVVLINASPICFGHSLLCPNIDKYLPQVVTLESLILVTQVMFLSSNRDLRVGFNSLCAMASVNHLHYHFMIVNYRLPVETLECDHLKGPLYSLDKNYPAQGFCFQIKSKDEIISVCSDIYKLITYLMDNNIAHNLAMTKGDALDKIGSVLRVIVWARTSFFGSKRSAQYNAAFCEFSGQFPVKSQSDLTTLNEENLSTVIKEIILPVFNDIREDVIALY